MTQRSGRHFLQIPGPTNVPDRILRAIDQPTVDHRGPAFAELGREVLAGLKAVFKTEGHIVIYPASGTGAAEAALVNILSEGDKILLYETGHFSDLWLGIAGNLGIEVDYIPNNWREGIRTERIEERLSRDTEHQIKAICVVHNETSTGVLSDLESVGAALRRSGHPALLIADVISSLGSMDFRQDEWGVDIAVTSSQKGLMLPPGLGINAISEKALHASENAGLKNNYWEWRPMVDINQKGFFRYTPATNLLYGLREALRMFAEEGLDRVFARHARHGAATRQAVKAWNLEIFAANRSEWSQSMTAVLLPEGYSADQFRKVVLENFDMSLGNGLGQIQDKVFRIGHLGSLNDLMLAGTLSGIEMGLSIAGVPHNKGGVQAALDYLATNDQH